MNVRLLAATGGITAAAVLALRARGHHAPRHSEPRLRSNARAARDVRDRLFDESHERSLDESIEGTFPASDPLAATPITGVRIGPIPPA